MMYYLEEHKDYRFIMASGEGDSSWWHYGSLMDRHLLGEPDSRSQSNVLIEFPYKNSPIMRRDVALGKSLERLKSNLRWG